MTKIWLNLLLIGLTYLLDSAVAQDPLFSSVTDYDMSFDRPELAQRGLSWIQQAQMAGLTSPEGMENCSPVGSYIVYREGTTFPDAADIQALNQLQDRIRRQPINQNFRFLNQIPNGRLPVLSAGQLTEVGRRELQELGARVKARFVELFGLDMELANFDFQSINTSSSLKSAVAFVQGLVGLNQICETTMADGNLTVTCNENSQQTRLITPTSAHIPYDMDPLLQPSEARARCLRAVNKGKTLSEVRAFQKGRQFMELTDKIATKLTPPGQQLWNISQADVQLLSKICGYHVAIFKDNNTWCRLFEYEDLNVAEYERELQHFWDESYGFPLNSRVACPLLNNTLEYLERFTTRSAISIDLPLMSVKFTDGDTLMRLASAMGIYKDDQLLLASNYGRSRDRQFRSAKMVPFGGNLAANIYRCQMPGRFFFNEQRYRVQVLLNERPVNITFCTEHFCELDVFTAGLFKQAGECRVQRDCNVAMGLGGRGRNAGGGGGGQSDASQLSGRFTLPMSLFAAFVAKIVYNSL